MKRIIIIISALIILFNNSLSAKIVEYVVSSVNGEPITLLDLKSWMFIILGKDKWENLTAGEKKILLKEVINRNILEFEAGKAGISVDEEEINFSINDVLKRRKLTRQELEEELKNHGTKWKDYVSEIRHQILKEKILQKLIFPKIQEDNEILRDFFLKNKDRFKSKESVHLYHIMLTFNDSNINDIKRIADEIYKELKTGKKFETVAEKYAGKNVSDIDLGFIQRGDLLPEFDSKVFATPEGSATPPLRSKNGYHIFYIKEKREPVVKSFEEALPEVRELYFKESADKLYDEWLGKVKNKYVIKIIDKDLKEE